MKIRRETDFLDTTIKGLFVLLGIMASMFTYAWWHYIHV